MPEQLNFSCRSAREMGDSKEKRLATKGSEEVQCVRVANALKLRKAGQHSLQLARLQPSQH